MLPVAIERDVVIACSTYALPSTGYEWRFHNTDSKRFTDQVIRLDASAASADHIKIDPTHLVWTNYVLAGFKAFHPTGDGDGEQTAAGGGGAAQNEKRGLNVLVDGCVPAGAGLSSSSALVVASALTALFARSCGTGTGPVAVAVAVAVGRAEIASCCARSERFVGTEGGGMDQAISLLATSGYAQHIHFAPRLHSQRVKLPPNGVWVVTHTLVEAHKQQSGQKNFNKRVVECRLSAVLLAVLISEHLTSTGTGKLKADPKLLPHPLAVKNLREIVMACGGASAVPALIELVKSEFTAGSGGDGYSQSELEKRIFESKAMSVSAAATGTGTAKPKDQLKLIDLLHGIGQGMVCNECSADPALLAVYRVQLTRLSGVLCVSQVLLYWLLTLISASAIAVCTCCLKPIASNSLLRSAISIGLKLTPVAVAAPPPPAAAVKRN